MNSFFYTDIYFYDIPMCHYSLLKNIGYDVSYIDTHDKFERNRNIGLIIKKFPRVGKLLRKMTISVVDNYIHINNINKSDIILRQYDSLFLKRPMKIVNTSVEMPLRHIFDKMVFSTNKKGYVGLTNKNKVIIKGISNRYPNMDEYLKKFIRFNFSSKKTTLIALQKLKNNLLDSNDYRDFLIPNGKNSFTICKKYGQIEIKKSFLKIMDLDEIDKIKFYNIYLKPFIQSLIFELI